jgi:hypothetical protein
MLQWRMSEGCSQRFQAELTNLKESLAAATADGCQSDHTHGIDGLDATPGAAPIPAVKQERTEIDRAVTRDPDYEHSPRAPPPTLPMLLRLSPRKGHSHRPWLLPPVPLRLQRPQIARFFSQWI